MSVLNTTVSYYPSIKATMQGVPVNLLNVLQSKKHKAIIEQLRNETDAEKQKLIKNSLPCYTVAGVFNQRAADGLVNHSGLAAVDLDGAEGYNTATLLRELQKIPFIAYAGLSCRGKRLFCIVPFEQVNLYEKHYERLIQSFEDIGLPMGDECHKQVSQPRFVTYNTNETCFYNHTAKRYHLLPIERTYHYPVQQYRAVNTNTNKIEVAVNMIRNATDGNKHNTLLKASCLIGGLVAGGVVNESEVIPLLESEIFAKQIDDKKAAQKTIQDGIKYGKQKPII